MPLGRIRPRPTTDRPPAGQDDRPAVAPKPATAQAHSLHASARRASSPVVPPPGGSPAADGFGTTRRLRSSADSPLSVPLAVAGASPPDAGPPRPRAPAGRALPPPAAAVPL